MEGLLNIRWVPASKGLWMRAQIAAAVVKPADQFSNQTEHGCCELVNLEMTLILMTC
jgi:hypothetical protein